jgi:hypothetical protein
LFKIVIRREVFLHETEEFKKWLKRKGLAWPDDPNEQRYIMAMCDREGLEEATERQKAVR